MGINRTMEVLEVVGNVLPEHVFNRLDKRDKEGTLAEVEYEIELISYSKGRPGRMYMPNGDPGYPDEPAEFETTMLPEEVAGMISKMVFAILEDDDCTPKNYALIWEEIRKTEEHWQYNNLDEKVYELVDHHDDDRY